MPLGSLCAAALVVFFAPALFTHEGDITIDARRVRGGLIGLIMSFPERRDAGHVTDVASVPAEAGDQPAPPAVESPKRAVREKRAVKTAHAAEVRERRARTVDAPRRVFVAQDFPRIEGVIGPAAVDAAKVNDADVAAHMRFSAKVHEDGVDRSVVMVKRPPRSNPLPYSETIERIAREYDVPAALAAAIIKVESGFKPRAVSHRGARGLMQLMPATASGVGVTGDIYDPERNIRAGVRYLKMMLDRYDGDHQLALAAYNAGPGAVDRYNTIPPYRETRRYVPAVMQYYRQYTEYFQDI